MKRRLEKFFLIHFPFVFLIIFGVILSDFETSILWKVEQSLRRAIWRTVDQTSDLFLAMMTLILALISLIWVVILFKRLLGSGEED